MHDIRFIRDHPNAFDKTLARRNLNDEERKRFSSQHLISIDDRRRAIIRVLESWQARRNTASKAIGEAKAKKDDSAIRKLMAEVVECKASISTLEGEQKAVEKELNDELLRIPNLPLEEVPDGKDEKANVECHKYGQARDFKTEKGEPFQPKQHFELGESLGQMDFETAAKLSGARFVILKRGLARLERALGQFMLDVHTSEPHDYTEIAPPLLVRDEVMIGTAQLPKFRDDQYFSTSAETLAGIEKIVDDAFDLPDLQKQQALYVERINRLLRNMYVHGFGAEAIEGAMVRAVAKIPPAMASQLQRPGNEPRKERFWLIPTAEVPLTNLVRESIVDEAQLPMRFTACTPCFRAEAGAAGKDTRGMIRQHQFTKVELVSITTPEQSKDEHERMLSCAEEILRRLELHYRVITLCAGDMGFASQKTYDIEVWLPGQNMYREISSCSVCGEFQARRMNARYRTREGRQVRHVHTLNGSGVAVGRALIAVMETYQQEDGSIAVPEALASYMGGMKKIEKQ
jgi:seryl-tRNA synthetase